MPLINEINDFKTLNDSFDFTVATVCHEYHHKIDHCKDLIFNEMSTYLHFNRVFSRLMCPLSCKLKPVVQIEK